MRRHLSLLGSAAALALCGMGSAAMADEFEAESKVVAATLYPRGALVERQAEFTLTSAGRHTLIVPGLPQNFDRATLRVEGEGEAAFSILAIDERAADVAALQTRLESERQRIFDAIQGLEDQKAYARNALDAAEAQKRMIEAMIQSQTDARSREKGAATVPVEDWAEFWRLTGEGIKSAQDSRVQTEVEIRNIDRRIEMLHAQLNETSSGASDASVLAVDVTAEAAGEITLVLRYQSEEALWRPVYDARLTMGEKPTVELTRRAMVLQTTGEPWEKVALTLSTARPSGRSAAPEPYSFEAGLQPPRPSVGMGGGGMAAMRGMAMESAAFAPPPPPPPAPIAMADSADLRQRKAAVVVGAASEMQGETVSFRIPDPADLGGDGASKQLLIGSEESPAEVVLRSSPRLDKSAYLQASFVNGSAAPILSGEASLYRDGVFVGRSSLGRAAPGDKAKVSFGQSDAVRVEFRIVEVKAEEERIFRAEKITSRRFEHKLENLTDQPQKITVLDAAPFTEDARIKINLVSDPAPTAREVDGRRGVVAWEIELKPRETRVLKFGYDVSFPSTETLLLP